MKRWLTAHPPGALKKLVSDLTSGLAKDSGGLSLNLVEGPATEFHQSLKFEIEAELDRLTMGASLTKKSRIEWAIRGLF